jgi:hypothetical protein
MGSSRKAPETVTRPMLLANSVNHMAPSGPAAIPNGMAPNVGTGNSVMTPEVVIRPIWSPAPSVNHELPSGPAVIPMTSSPVVGNSVRTPEVLIRPILLAPFSVNHRDPSVPAAMPQGSEICRRDGELGGDPGGGDPPDVVPVDLPEPQISV